MKYKSGELVIRAGMKLAPPEDNIKYVKKRILYEAEKF
jgi:hypothetical protein